MFVPGGWWTVDKNKLLQLLKQEEGPKLDFKAKLCLDNESAKKELTKDVIAMANSRGGRGYIIFGVEDKTKRLLGIDKVAFKEEQIQQIIYNRCDPPVPVAVDFAEVEGKLLAVLTVFKSLHQPHQMMQNGAFYIRRGSTTDTARRNEIANMLQENGLLTYETVILKNASLEDLDYDLLRHYFARLNVITDKLNEVLLEAMGIIGKKNDSDEFCPTIGGMLLFGSNVQTYLPNAYIKVTCSNNAEIFYGNILSLLDKAHKHIEGCLKVRNPESDKVFPVEAVSEAIANALAHRDYLDISRGIVVSIKEKHIEVSNPGALISGNSIYKYFNENNPQRRNSWLYQRLLTLDDKKRFMKSGMGMSRIKEAFKEIGEVKFINIGSQNLFKVIMPLQ